MPEHIDTRDPAYVRASNRLLWSRRLFFLTIPVWLLLAAVAVSIASPAAGQFIAIVCGGGYLATVLTVFSILGVCPNCHRNFYRSEWGLGNPFALSCMKCGKDPG